MANPKILRWGPYTTYIPLTHVGGNGTFRVGVGGNGNFRVGVGGNGNFSVGCVGGLIQREAPKPVVLRRGGI